MMDLLKKQQKLILLDLYCIEFPFYKLSALLETPDLHATVCNTIKAHKTPESICEKRREERKKVSAAEKGLLRAIV